MNLFLPLVISLFSFAPTDTVQMLPPVEITVSLKQSDKLSKQPITATTLSLYDLESRQIGESKDLSMVVPNLYLPDYGSKMTSSIYVRGIGARMEQPSMGLYIDNMPVLNKNNYDFDFFDIRRIDVLRGPQGTLYGRNTIGGVVDIRTLSPFDYEGTRIGMGYGNGNTMNFRVATYQKPTEDFGFSAAMGHNQSDGFYKNQYNNEDCDKIISDGFRFRLQWKLSEKWSLDNVFSTNLIKQDGFAYSLYDETTGKSQEVNHNDPCTYERLGVSDAVTLLYKDSKIQFSSTTSYQYMNDKMVLDQDFIPKSMFTLTQSQKENAFTQEYILKSTNSGEKWQWTSGVFGFYKQTSMNAPVTFKQDGIDELILANANVGIHTAFPNADLLIKEDDFTINSDFNLPAYGASIYHQSSFQLNKWSFVAGIRFDYEHTGIKYHNYADFHYRFTLTMPEYKLLSTVMQDDERMSFYEVMPRFSVLYELQGGNLYATVARGYKTGGFNTQIFSDILQNKMMSDMMSALGVSFGDVNSAYDVSSAISYKPEYSWNYEIGSHLSLVKNSLDLDAALFYIDCRNQQLTVFPAGQTTGRLMSNAGQTQSLGAEISVSYRYKDFRLVGSYGYTNAQFRSYNDGNNDYADNYVPYAPQNTVMLRGGYSLFFDNKWIDHLLFQVDWKGVGKIYWDESNSLFQPFYGQLGASISCSKNNFTFILWGKNLTDTKFNTFYFKSMGNSFVQRGKPAQIGLSLNINI